MAFDKSDRLYAHRKNPLEPFQFNKQVANVFSDMAERSIPGYRQLLEVLSSIVPSILAPDKQHTCYDLGCSLGAASYQLAYALSSKRYPPATIYAIDQSPAMIKALEQSLTEHPKIASLISPHCADITKQQLQPCSLVVLHYTLQFLDYENKQMLIDNIYQSLNPGGWLLMSEKMDFQDFPEIEQWHSNFKRDMGYSELEIAQKRQALENVMLTDSLDIHKKRLASAGFTAIGCWHQSLNFVALAARK